jgi:hypothetical protein
MRLEWKTDDDAVKTINRMGIEWELATVSISSIDVKTSRHNHARKKAIIETNVDDYADAMDRGDVFPRIVLARVDGGKQWIVAGGNHRIAAAIKAGATEVDAYTIECDKSLFSILCPALNLYVGQREDRSVRIAQAADAVARLGVTQKQAAEDYRVPVSSVNHAVTEAKVVISAAKLGIKADDLPSSFLRAISPVEGDSVLLPLAVELAKTKLNCEEIRSAVSQARKMPTEADRVCVLKEKIQAAKKITLSGRIQTQPTRARIMRCVTILEKAISDGVTFTQLQITKSEAIEIINKMHSWKARLLDAE